MATYDETVGTASIPWDMKADGGFFRLEEELVVATAIANHATPTANGYFTVDDIIQLIDYPASCVFLYSIFRTVVAGTTAAATCDLGENGGQEFDAAVALDATAGTVVVGVVAAGTEDNFYSAANTADLEVLTQNLLTGSYVWSIVGIHCG
jgi:hypothetical protein